MTHVPGTGALASYRDCAGVRGLLTWRHERCTAPGGCWGCCGASQGC
ncbi:hypothetical protein V6Z12_A08G092200 [Gossypium hirsutum]